MPTLSSREVESRASFWPAAGASVVVRVEIVGGGESSRSRFVGGGDRASVCGEGEAIAGWPLLVGVEHEG